MNRSKLCSTLLSVVAPLAACSNQPPAGTLGPAADLAPRPVLRFQTRPPRDESDYPYSAEAPPARGPAPRSTVFLSAVGSGDPEGSAVSLFWNVQDPFGAYAALAPTPEAARVSFSPAVVGSHVVTLAVVEVAGLRQIGLTVLTLEVAPVPCAEDGVSAPCADGLAVAGGAFRAGSAAGVGYVNEHPDHAATVAPFVLDKYEVTVGRFRRYLSGYTGEGPADGAGAHPLIAGSGWQPAWIRNLPATRDEFMFALSECGGPWTNDVGPSEPRPITCVTWFEAFALCASENKRLPTEAEWEYAAAGGDDQRTYPWGEDPPSSDRVVFGCLFDGAPSCSDADLPVAGSLAAGAGRWGHLDLAGSVWEWTLDVYAPYSAAPCDNCADVTDSDEAGRVFRGGDFKFDDPASLRAPTRYAFNPAYPEQTRGFRCAFTASGAGPTGASAGPTGASAGPTGASARPTGASAGRRRRP